MTDNNHIHPEGMEQLEAELQQLQLRPLSADFGRRLASRLCAMDRPEQAAPLRTSHPPRVALALLILASLLLAVTLIQDQPSHQVTMTHQVFEMHQEVPTGIAHVSADEPALPTLLSYSLALRHPDEDLERLLDRHAAVLLPAAKGLISEPVVWPR